jgi:hypothetical protein
MVDAACKEISELIPTDAVAEADAMAKVNKTVGWGWRTVGSWILTVSSE